MKKLAFTSEEENCQVANSVCKFGRVEDAQYNYKAFTLAEVLMAQRTSRKECLHLLSRESKPKEPSVGNKKTAAFTLAEVLITLAIIGIVSALVIPSVLKNYNDKKYNTARLKALKTFGEAGKLASINGEINGQPTAKDFVNNVLSKYLKITKVCDKADECGFPSEIQPNNPNTQKITSDSLVRWNRLNADIGNIENDYYNTKLQTYIQTADGFSAKVFYNPNCIRDSHEACIYETGKNLKLCEIYMVKATCMNVIYDMNGKKAPNHVGEDIGFVTTFWSGIKALSVAPGMLPYDMNSETPRKSYAVSSNYCREKTTSTMQISLANMYELSSLYLNYNFSSLPRMTGIWSGSSDQSDTNFSKAWAIYGFGGAHNGFISTGEERGAYCVRR